MPVIQFLPVVFVALHVRVRTDIAIHTSERIVVVLLLHVPVLIHHDAVAPQVIPHVVVVLRLVSTDGTISAVEAYAVQAVFDDDERSDILHAVVYVIRWINRGRF